MIATVGGVISITLRHRDGHGGGGRLVPRRVHGRRPPAYACHSRRRVVSQVSAYGAVVSSEPRLAPSSWNCTPATPTLSEALAETVDRAGNRGAVAGSGE